MIRTLDIIFSIAGLLTLAPLIVAIMLISLFDTGSPLFYQQRVGRYQKPFILIKFRTMHIDTPSVATHLADAKAVTTFGRFLRRSKLDELPQLWNVLKGDMSLVGPRPCLPNQTELIDERAKRGVFEVRPGITGLAQISGIDMSSPSLLAEIDMRMVKDLSLTTYLRYIFQTLFGHGLGDRIRQ